MGIDTSNANTTIALTPKSAPCPPYDHVHIPAEHIPDETTVLTNNLNTRARRSFQKVTSAFTEYPVKGLKGDKKSTFYEFLTMGNVPYIIGSLTFMGLFNGAPKWFPNVNKKGARHWGNRMALGVLFYGLAKNLSKSLVTVPVKMATGIDTEMPYQKVSYTIPERKDAAPDPLYEQHKVFESRDFPRYDILYGMKEGEPRNYYFDKIAKKNGLGKNLEASDGEVKPLIKDVISRSSTAKSLSTYMWGGVGVMLAVQPAWVNFFKALSKNSWTKFVPNRNENKFINLVDKGINAGKNIGRIAKSFGRNFVKAAKELYKGPATATGFNKHAGKVFLGVATAISALGAINTIYGAKSYGNRKITIDNNKKVQVD